MNVVLIGNVVDGTTIFGPFEDWDAAYDWIVTEAPDAEYHIAGLVQPNW